jgi:hypothetical protein
MAKKAEAEKMTKADAVRAAIKAGHDMPQAASEYIKTSYGLEVTPQQFSTYKSLENKRGGKKARKAQATASPVPKATQTVHASNPADLARGVKSLVETFGADAVKGMVGVFE